MDRETELALVSRLRTGDAAAFDAVLDALHRRVFAFLVRLSRRPDVAEDLSEETWLRLVSHASKLAPDTRLLPWLLAVARNLHTSYWRSRALDASLSDGLIDLWAVAPRPGTPFDEAATNELEEHVVAALQSLPTPARESILLVAVEGFSTADAAEICGITPDAFRQRLCRARAMLAVAMDDMRAGAPAARPTRGFRKEMA
jgi:RNA polymerase sigma factor (sigma-70 family)